MKKQLFFLTTGALLALASCQQQNTAGGFTQEQVDSIVNARVAEQMIALKASNDSMINAMALMKADSIIAAMKGEQPKPQAKVVTKTTTVHNGGGKVVKKEDPRSVNTRPGASKQGEVKSVSDRPGASKQGENKSVSDRPGAH
jgi:hypothetical protein